MIEIKYLPYVCTWLVFYFILQFRAGLIIQPYLSIIISLSISFAVCLLFSTLISWYLALIAIFSIFFLKILLILLRLVLGTSKYQIPDEPNVYISVGLITLFTSGKSIISQRIPKKPLGDSHSERSKIQPCNPRI